MKEKRKAKQTLKLISTAQALHVRLWSLPPSSLIFLGITRNHSKWKQIAVHPSLAWHCSTASELVRGLTIHTPQLLVRYYKNISSYVKEEMLLFLFDIWENRFFTMYRDFQFWQAWGTHALKGHYLNPAENILCSTLLVSLSKISSIVPNNIPKTETLNAKTPILAKIRDYFMNSWQVWKA